MDYSKMPTAALRAEIRGLAKYGGPSIPSQERQQRTAQIMAIRAELDKRGRAVKIQQTKTKSQIKKTHAFLSKI